MKKIIRSKEIYLEDKILDGYILIDGEEIKELNEKNIWKDETIKVINLENYKVFPGLIDIHVHGGNGFDTMGGTFEDINEISKFKIKEGVTSFCPTTVTASKEKTDKAITNIADCVEKGVDGAKIIGTFLEGPFIAKEKKGAHPEEFITDIDIEEIDRLLTIGRGTIKSIAIAPEKENAYEAIEFLSGKGVNVRVGHSAAKYDEVIKAIDKGANVGIHTYNAMSPLGHREPGVVGAILDDDRIYGEIIADFVHVHPAPIKILATCKPGKVILITDCLEAGGLSDGNYKLGELDIVVENSIAKLKGLDTIAGSTLSLINGIKNVNTKVGIDLLETVCMGSLYPARALGIDDKLGSININKKADIIAVDEDFNVKFVMINGENKLEG